MMIWFKAKRGLYHLHTGGGYICGVRVNFDDCYQVDSSDDPPGDERCKNCIRMIDHIHHRAHIYKDRVTDEVQYRYGKWPMIFTRKLVICGDFRKIEKIFTNVWVQYSGEVDDKPLRGSIAVYPNSERGYADTREPDIIRIKNGRYYKFE